MTIKISDRIIINNHALTAENIPTKTKIEYKNGTIRYINTFTSISVQDVRDMPREPIKRITIGNAVKSIQDNVFSDFDVETFVFRDISDVIIGKNNPNIYQ